MSWPPSLLLVHPTWTLDATAMALDEAAIDALPWASAFAEMVELEAGAVANPDEGRQVGHYWLRAPERAPTVGQATAIGETVEAVRDFARQVRAGKIVAEDGLVYTDVLHVGIGGSALGPQLVIDALRDPWSRYPGSEPDDPRDQGLRLHWLDNTDPDGIARVIDAIGHRLRHTLVVVVSKSGGTAETRSGMLLVQEACVRAKVDVPSRMVAITGEGSALASVAKKDDWRKIFPMWDWVGGRTSVASAVGLLPMELAGIDTAAFLGGARDMDEWTRDDDWRRNPAALLAGCWHVAGGGRGDRAMVVLPYSDRLLLFSRYLQQLVMESIGKEHDREGRVVEQGLAVYGNKGSTDQHAFVQQLRDGRDDFFATFVQVLEDGLGSPSDVAAGANAGDFLQGFLLGTRRALRDKGRPSLTITVPRVDPYVLGGLVALYERAVGLYAALIGINAYHQPGVEAGKKAAGEVLQLSKRVREELRTGGAAGAATLAARIGADAVETYYVLERLVASGRLGRDGSPPTATYRTRKASD